MAIMVIIHKNHMNNSNNNNTTRSWLLALFFPSLYYYCNNTSNNNKNDMNNNNNKKHYYYSKKYSRKTTQMALRLVVTLYCCCCSLPSFCNGDNNHNRIIDYYSHFKKRSSSSSSSNKSLFHSMILNDRKTTNYDYYHSTKTMKATTTTPVRSCSRSKIHLLLSSVTNHGNHQKLLLLSSLRGGSNDGTIANEQQQQQPIDSGTHEQPSNSNTELDTTTSTILQSELETTAAAAVVTNQAKQPSLNYKLLLSKLSNFRQRAIPAILLLIGLYGIVHTFEHVGLSMLFLLCSIGLYYEASNVIHCIVNTTNSWWWFGSYSMATTIPQTISILLLDNNPFNASSKIQQYHALCHLISCCMIVIGYLQWIIHLNNHVIVTSSTTNNTNEEQKQQGSSSSLSTSFYKEAWNEISYYQMCALLTVIPVSFWMALLHLRPYGLVYALYTAGLIMINDTSAYIVGSLLGKIKFLPILSPNKTLEGFIGAFLSTVGLSIPLWNLLLYKFTKNQNVHGSTNPYNIHSMVIALYCSLLGPVGGYIASSIKRTVHKKDFGTLIAGHGGLLDRFDCQLFVIPFVYLYLQYIATL